MIAADHVQHLGRARVPGPKQTLQERDLLRIVAPRLDVRDGRDGSVTIHQDVDLYATLLGTDETVSFELRAGRQAWIQVARGAVRLGDRDLSAGDGAAVTEATELVLTGSSDDAEVLLFDLAG